MHPIRLAASCQEPPPTAVARLQAGYGRTVRLWDTSPQSAAVLICATSGTPITQHEWAQYVPGQPCQPPCGGTRDYWSRSRPTSRGRRVRSLFAPRALA